MYIYLWQNPVITEDNPLKSWMTQPLAPIQGCQIFRETVYQNRGKYLYQKTTKLPKGHTIHQLAVTYSKWPYNIPTSSLQNFPKSRFFGLKICHLATLPSSALKWIKIIKNEIF
jgi:hypothetical protein